ncbi:MAG: Glyoxalase/bleomycin resistance protein/dioxygenase [Actinomycetia bacterium]|nr:Glyoxalase/bleomycin resistance protein/dioxygenase [Actinomycetes bacterium]
MHGPERRGGWCVPPGKQKGSSTSVPELDECVRFFTDFGLVPIERGGSATGRPGAQFATQTGQAVELRAVDDPVLPPPVQDGPSLREIVWGVDTAGALQALVTDLATGRVEFAADMDRVDDSYGPND